jgi:hypothetical protein
MFTIDQRLGYRSKEWVEPTKSRMDRADCNDAEARTDHHPGIHHEPERIDRMNTRLVIKRASVDLQEDGTIESVSEIALEFDVDLVGFGTLQV